MKEAHANRIQLWSDGFYRTPKIHYDKTTLTGRPFYHFSYGAACLFEVVIDTLTGESRVLKVDILHDVGQHQPGHRRRADRGRLRPGHGLAHHRATGGTTRATSTHAPAPTKFRPRATFPSTLVDLWPEANREDNVAAARRWASHPSCWRSGMRRCVNAIAAGAVAKRQQSR